MQLEKILKNNIIKQVCQITDVSVIRVVNSRRGYCEQRQLEQWIKQGIFYLETKR